MNRKDTIIVAVLVNAGILAVLFMLAINPEEDLVQDALQQQTTLSLEAVPAKIEAVEPLSVLKAHPQDELDAALKEFAMGETPAPVLIDEEFLDPTPAKTDNQSSEGIVVTVKKGDSLEKIAKLNGTTVDALRKANQLKSDTLRIGQLLMIPAKQPVQTGQASESRPTEPQYYIIKSGDNPWKIAKQFKVKFDDLLKLNNLDEDKARGLKPGDKIRVQ